jgi:hypothetical protein
LSPASLRVSVELVERMSRERFSQRLAQEASTIRAVLDATVRTILPEDVTGHISEFMPGSDSARSIAARVTDSKGGVLDLIPKYWTITLTLIRDITRRIDWLKSKVYAG